MFPLQYYCYIVLPPCIILAQPLLVEKIEPVEPGPLNHSGEYNPLQPNVTPNVTKWNPKRKPSGFLDLTCVTCGDLGSWHFAIWSRPDRGISWSLVTPRLFEARWMVGDVHISDSLVSLCIICPTGKCQLILLSLFRERRRWNWNVHMAKGIFG